MQLILHVQLHIISLLAAQVPLAWLKVLVSCALPSHALSSLRPTALLTAVIVLNCCAVILQLPHIDAMEELHRHPLWRYGSTAAQWPEPRSASSKPLAPAEAESALLAYVRMASEAEQQQCIRRQDRQARLSTADIAAELHALYTLAANHVANQQDSEQQAGTHHRSKQSLTDGDIMQLLKAYASVEDSSQQHSKHRQQAAGDAEQCGEEWDSKKQAAAAAMGALYAFARLADQQQEAQQEDGQQDGRQQQQQAGQAPGQLQASSSDSSSAVQAYKSLANGTRGQASSGDASSSRSSNSSASGDLQVLLKLAQLGLHAASG
jgi:hypothetical protein